MASSLVAGGLIAGCGGDDTNNPTPTTDAGNDVDNTGDADNTDTGTTDSGPSDTGTVDAGPNAKVILVHASPNVPAIRFCFGINAGATNAVANLFPALPDKKAADALPWPGVFPGTGGVFPDLGIDLAPIAITPYAILAANIKDDTSTTGPDGGTTERKCDKLIGAAGTGGDLKLGTDYFQLQTLPAGTFGKGKTIMIAAVGCLPGGTVAQCGPDYNVTNGNVGLKVLTLDRSAAPTGGSAFQVANLASPLLAEGLPNGVFPYITVPVDGGAVDAGDAGDAGPPAATKIWIGTPNAVTFGNLAPAPGTVVQGLDENLSKFNFSGSDKGAPFNAALGFPLINISAATLGTPTPGYIKASGGSYTVVIVGDPTESPTTDAGTPNGHFLHYLAFPNDPPVVKQQ